MNTSNISWTHVQVMKSKVSETYLMILMSKNRLSSIEFMKLLENHPFELRVDRDKEKYKFILNFLESENELFIIYEQKPEFLNLLKSGAIKAITTGHTENGLISSNDTKLPLNQNWTILN